MDEQLRYVDIIDYRYTYPGTGCLTWPLCGINLPAKGQIIFIITNTCLNLVQTIINLFGPVGQDIAWDKTKNWDLINIRYHKFARNTLMHTC